MSIRTSYPWDHSAGFQTRGRLARQVWFFIALTTSIAGVGCALNTDANRRTLSASEALSAVEGLGHAAVEPTRRPSVEGPLVILNATVLTATGTRHEPGFVVIQDGRIKNIGSGLPEGLDGMRTLNAEGHFITPGLIDTHSHMGVYPSPSARAHSDGNESTAPVTAGVWAEHAFWPQDPGLERALAGGVTTIQVLPGSANLIGGRTVTLHLVPHRGSRAMRFPGAPDGLKMACGENPKRIYGMRGQAPRTRMGNLAGQRAAFIQAQDHLRSLNNKDLEEVSRDLGLETLAGVLEGHILAHIHCYRADDMLNMMQLAFEFGFKVRSFHHAVSAYKIRDILAEHEVSISTWADWWGFKLEAHDAIRENAAMLSEAGVRAIIHSDSARGVQRLNQEAAKAFYAGRQADFSVTENDALRWITANPAWALGIDAEVGTLEVGKRADLVIWDAHPFSVYTSARWVFVDGVLLYDKATDGEPWSDFEVGLEVQP
jgi:imidazolonepropionase-like amidohydrolase